MAVIIMSIKPEYEEEIMRGDKGVELRVYGGRIEPGDFVIVYTTKPVGAVRSVFCVEDAPVMSARDALEGITNGRFKGGATDDVYLGERIGKRIVVVVVGDKARVEPPITLEEIREAAPKWMPPINYRRAGQRDEWLVKEVLKRLGKRLSCVEES